VPFPVKVEIKVKSKINVKGVGQECPTHTSKVKVKVNVNWRGRERQLYIRYANSRSSGWRRRGQAMALRRVLGAKIPLEGAADDGVSESIYRSDPDENGVELYCDKPREKWPRTALF